MTSSRLAPVGSLAPEQVREVLTAAQLAPSVCQRRPWRFECTDSAIELHLDLSREPRGTDPQYRRAWLACGGALLNLRLAIRLCGVDDAVQLLPDAERGDLLAVVQISGSRPVTPDVLGLAAVMTGVGLPPQHCWTGPMPGALPAELRHAARIEQAWLATISAAQFPALRPLISLADQPQLAGPAPLIAAIGTFSDDHAARLRAGQAIQRVVLTARTWGLQAHFLGTARPLILPRLQLRRVIGGGLWPHVLLRLGEDPR